LRKYSGRGDAVDLSAIDLDPFHRGMIFMLSPASGE
jgi:hypothetical protein